MEKMIKRRINAQLKPRRKNLTQTFRFPRKELRKEPGTVKANQSREESRDRKQKRLKLKTGSVFSKKWWMKRSVNIVIEKKVKPKSSPEGKPK